MEFNEQQLQALDNLMKFLRRCQLPDATGEEYLAFSQSYYFLYDLKQKSLEISQRKQAQAEAMTKTSMPKPTKSKKTKNKE